MANYLSPHCPHLSTIIRPLTELTNSDTPYMCAKAQDDAFNKAEHLISTDPVLQWYDLNKPLQVKKARGVRLSSSVVKAASNL